MKASPVSFLSLCISSMVCCAWWAHAESEFMPLTGTLPPTVSKAEKPYLVTEVVTVEEGEHTIIEKGVVILFKNFSGIEVKGTLRVEGSISDPVVFTSENDSIYNPGATLEPAAFDWDGITVHPGEAENVFEHCVIQYSLFGIKSLTQRITITDCVFKENGNADVTIEGEKLVVTSPYNYTGAMQAVAPAVTTAESVDEIFPPEEKESEPKLDLKPKKKYDKKEDTRASLVTEPKKRGRAGMALFRIAGLAACAVGGAFGVKEHLAYIEAKDEFDAINDFDNEDKLHHTKEDWELAKNHANDHMKKMLAFYGAGFAAFLTFTISFAF